MIEIRVKDSSDTFYWFAIQTRSRHEKVVRDELEKRNIEYFLPTVRRLSQWTDRKKQIEVPLFAGYCFARFSSSDRLPVLQSQGVVRLVGSGGRPAPVSDDEIESLRKLINNASEYVCHSYLTFKEGMLVEVISGPLQGVKGRLVREARRSRLVVGITLLQRAVAVEVGRASVVPAHCNMAFSKNLSNGLMKERYFEADRHDQPLMLT